MPASFSNIALFALLSLSLFGCGGSNEPAEPTAATAAAVGEVPDLNTLIANADEDHGETVYFQCRACHTLYEGGGNKVGPNLWKMFGREAGSVAGFAYSDAVKNSGIIWTPETVDAWLEQPANVVPGNNMVFVGVKKPQDRADLILYLQVYTGGSTE